MPRWVTNVDMISHFHNRYLPCQLLCSPLLTLPRRFQDLLAVPDFRHGYFLNCTKVMLSWNHPWPDICVHQGTMPRKSAAACVVSERFNTHDYLKTKYNYMQDN